MNGEKGIWHERHARTAIILAVLVGQATGENNREDAHENCVGCEDSSFGDVIGDLCRSTLRCRGEWHVVALNSMCEEVGGCEPNSHMVSWLEEDLPANPYPNSEVRNSDTYGVLKLTLSPGNYGWEFVPVEGKTFTDSGRQSCH